MSSNNLADIVEVNIDIQSPVVDSTSFDHLLIVGPCPATVYNDDFTVEEIDAPPTVGTYTSLEGVNDAGWKSEDGIDPVGDAARVAFSQSPKPSKIYIAVQQRKPLSTAISAAFAASLPSTLSAVYEQSESGVTGALEVVSSGAVNGTSILLSSITATVAGYTPSVGHYVKLTDDYTSEDGEFLIIQYPYNSVVPSITKNGTSFIGYVSVHDTAGSKTYIIIDLASITTCAFHIDVPTYSMVVDSDTTEYDARFVCKWTENITASTVHTINLSEYESISTTLNRALGTTGWYIICPAGVDEDDYEKIAEWTEAQTKMACFVLTSVSERTFGSVYFRSFDIFCKEEANQNSSDIPTNNKYENVAFVAKCLRFKSGSETWAFKTLATIEPTTFTSTDISDLKNLKASYYTAYASRNITQGGMVAAGEWIDVIRFRDWLQNDMQIRIYNLFVVNPKIPYTDDGIALIRNQMIASLKEGQKMGGVAMTEYDEDGNEIPGFTVSVPLAANISSSQKASRILSDCRFAARLAGAIHAVKVNGSLTYKL